MVSGNFATVAPSDGVVTDLDEEHGIMEFTPAAVVVQTTGKMDVRYPGDELQKTALTHGGIYVLMEKAPGKVGESYTVKAGVVVTIKSLTDEAHPELLPEHIRKTYDGSMDHPLVLVGLQVTPAKYNPPAMYFEYGARFTTISGAQIKQDLVPNVAKGEKVKRGDVLIYNEGFFSVPTDPWDPAGARGANWNHGVMANIVLMEKTSNYEDACTVYEGFARKLEMTPAHIRRITVERHTAVEDLVAVGDHVSSTDPLCNLRDGQITDITDDNTDGDSLFFDAMTKKPVRARYDGKIAAIEFVYACDPNTMSDSLKALVRKYESKKRKYNKLSKSNGSSFTVKSGYIRPGTKYQGEEFTEDTVMIEITVEKTYPAGQADKLCIMSACKTTIANVYPQPAYGTVTGTQVDVIFSATSVFKRMVMTPFINGKANRTTEAAEKKLVSILFD